MIEQPTRVMDTRLRVASFLRHAFDHVFPDHWSFMLGEIALYSFVILVMTGLFLIAFYNGSSAHVTYYGSYKPLDGIDMTAAYRSMLHISFDVPAGLLVRQMHHWACDIFIAAIVAHQARIFFTAAYRKPREINWVIGMTLLVLALCNGYAGYSMGGDELSGAGLRIGYSIFMSIPVIGPWFTFVVMGGTYPNSATIPRLFALHIFVVPMLLGVLIALHLGIIWRQYHTNFPGPERSNVSIVGSRMWPSYTLKSLGLFLILFGIIAALGGLVQIDPIWVYGPYNPIGVLPGAQPDWYLGWIEGAMRLFPEVNLHLGSYLVPEVFFSAVLFPGLLFLVLYLWPFMEKAFSRDRDSHNILHVPSHHPVSTALGCAVFSCLIVLEFAGGDDVIALENHGSVVWVRALLRVLFFVVPAVVYIFVYLLCRSAKKKHEAKSLQAEAEAAPLPQ